MHLITRRPFVISYRTMGPSWEAGRVPSGTGTDFEKFPFDDIPGIFWETYTPHLESIARVMPPGMKAFGGCGYGIFETSQDLVGYEYLCVMLYEDPDLFADLFVRIGEPV